MKTALPILLKFDGYPPGVALSLLMHALLLYILLPNDDRQEFMQVQEPSFVTATVATANPQRQQTIRQEQARIQQQQEEQRELREREQQLERERQAARQREEAERQAAAKREADRKAAAEREAEQRRVAEQERQQREQAERERAERERVERERVAEAERRRAEEILNANNAAAEAAAAANAEMNLVAQYAAIIKREISRSWDLPAGAAKAGLTAVLRLRLVPTGEIIDSSIVRSSGDPIFDRSVLQAVERVQSFPELQDLPSRVFNSNFREINLEFRPEDLL